MTTAHHTTVYRTEAGGAELRRRYAELLDRWPVPAKRLRVPTREGETFVLASGPAGAPPVLLFHGSGTNSAMWMADVAGWAEHFRVYAVDMIGEPGLSAPARPPLDSDAYARWLDDVFDGLGVERAALVGTSLGGWLAIDYATRRPDRVRRLALLCPGGIGRQTFRWVLPALLLRPLGRWGIRQTLRIVAGLDSRRFGPAADYFLTVHREFRHRRDPLPIFSDAALGRLAMPVLVIAGTRDAMIDSADTARRLAGAVPHAAVTLLPGVGHAVIGQGTPILEFLLSDEPGSAPPPAP